MTSPSSGFVSLGSRNHSGTGSFERNVPVPSNTTVVVSFKEYTYALTDVYLYRHFRKPLSKDLRKVLVWMRSMDAKSDVAHVLQTVRFSVTAKLESCTSAPCFKLFFSFYDNESQKPVWSVEGLWNCSVNHYHSSFHQHLACNLKTECEDAQDETGQCPFSSAQCNGLIAMCDHCYKIVNSLSGFKENMTDFNKRASKYCRSIQSWQSFPTCDYNWYVRFRNQTKLHPDWLKSLWVGVHSNDLSLPLMYRHALVREGRTVSYHLWRFTGGIHIRSKACYHTYVGNKILIRLILVTMPCMPKYSSSLGHGTMCEFSYGNSTKKHNNKSKEVSTNGTNLSLKSGEQYMTVCSEGHLTYDFFLCGSDRYKICGEQGLPVSASSNRLSQGEVLLSNTPRVSCVATFACVEDSAQISYSLVCDFITDCDDNGDESFCKHPPCVRSFTCDNGQCLSFDQYCNNVLNCRDESDEENCPRIRFVSKAEHIAFSSPALIRFNGIAEFISTPMKSNESCPGSHYRCPGAFNDCLPVYTRCNGMYDCVDREDEEGCAGMNCPGLFRCRHSTMCLHTDHVCDSWPHCLLYDDELACNITCPVHCSCHGHSFHCSQPFSAALFPQLRFLDGTGSRMTLQDVNNNALLIGLVLAHCSLKSLPRVRLRNVRFLDLSRNQLQSVQLTFVLGLDNLHTLSLSSNPVSSLHTDLSSGDQHTALTVLHLAHTSLTVLDTTVLSLFSALHTLNLTSTSIHTISPEGFQFTPQLKDLHMDNSLVKTFPPDIFQGLANLKFVSSQNYKLCCADILPHSFDSSACLAPKDEISSCKDLLQSWTYRVFLWLMACLSLTGNVFCCCTRLFVKSMASSSGFSVFVTNLTMADFLMGVYIAMIGVADEQFRGRYLHNDDSWKNSVTCKMAGFLSLLSSEVSVFMIWFITIDRYVVLRFPFSSKRFGKTSASVVCLLNWLVGLCLALVPLLPITSHWEFYSQTGICIPLPVTRQNFKGRFYSISILIVFNFVLFLSISIGQAFIYWTVQNNNDIKVKSTRVSNDVTIARRLMTIAVTDFLCWFPIGLCGMLALGGVPIPGEVSVALSVVVLPLNSAVNPFLYTFNTLVENRRKVNYSKLMRWLESHSGLIGE